MVLTHSAPNSSTSSLPIDVAHIRTKRDLVKTLGNMSTSQMQLLCVNIEKRFPRRIGQDVAIETIESIWKWANSDEPLHNPIGYILTTATNIAVQIQKQEQKLPEDQASLPALQNEGGKGPSLEEQVCDAMSYVRLIKIMGDVLPKDECAIITMHVIYGWSFVDIAKKIELGESATKQRFYRARVKLKMHLCNTGPA